MPRLGTRPTGPPLRPGNTGFRRTDQDVTIRGVAWRRFILPSQQDKQEVRYYSYRTTLFHWTWNDFEYIYNLIIFFAAAPAPARADRRRIARRRTSRRSGPAPAKGRTTPERPRSRPSARGRLFHSGATENKQQNRNSGPIRAFLYLLIVCRWPGRGGKDRPGGSVTQIVHNVRKMSLFCYLRSLIISPMAAASLRVLKTVPILFWGAFSSVAGEINTSWVTKCIQ